LSPNETANSIPQELIIEAIKKANYGGDDPVETLMSLSIDTGLFAEERKGETERFLHLTICEFLAAVEVVEDGITGWERLFKYIENNLDINADRETRFWRSRLSEVVAFASGLAGRSMRERILDDLATLDDPQLLLRAIIEAQAYDESLAITAIRSECDFILEQTPPQWDLAWFTRIQTIVTVPRDASMGHSIPSATRSPSLPDSSSLLKTLIERYDAEDMLLSTLARQDADAAIAIAEATSTPKSMDHVAVAADDFAVLQGILARYEAGVRGWSGALIKRAFVDQSIAKLLHSIEADHAMYGEAAKGKWSRCFITRNSLYGVLLDDALNGGTSNIGLMANLFGHLSKVRPPRTPREAGRRESFMALFALFAIMTVFIGAGIFATTITGNQNGWESILPLVAAISAPVIIIVLLRAYLHGSFRSFRVRNTKKTSISFLVTIRSGRHEFDISSDNLTASRGEEDERDSGDKLVNLNRTRTIRAILNLQSYRFGSFGVILEFDHAFGGKERFAAFLNGVPLLEVRCLQASYAVRRSPLGVANAQLALASPRRPDGEDGTAAPTSWTSEEP